MTTKISEATLVSLNLLRHTIQTTRAALLRRPGDAKRVHDVCDILRDVCVSLDDLALLQATEPDAEPAPPAPEHPGDYATVPVPIITRYTGGAAPEGALGRVWIKVDDDGPDVEYVPASATAPQTVLDALNRATGRAEAYRWAYVSSITAGLSAPIERIESELQARLARL